MINNEIIEVLSKRLKKVDRYPVVGVVIKLKNLVIFIHYTGHSGFHTGTTYFSSTSNNLYKIINNHLILKFNKLLLKIDISNIKIVDESTLFHTFAIENKLTKLINDIP